MDRNDLLPIGDLARRFYFLDWDGIEFEIVSYG